ncbi:probable ATP-binding domain 1 family member B [Cephalotrichum gorgonifer]|uniref:GPN-loop GTPase 2 n=1 Tax=Cephalotrichum gorgonifer TaxID=2041049 RepID=A0AAE8MTG9_9PEZI|nr:probable ATP-binding domain 1 family member B [Cephalotrichum gorgonifer]
MPFAQLVLGSPGAGKSTYCDGMHQFLGAIGRACSVVNLDPANDRTNYPCAIDIRNLVKLEEAMADDNLGPNGGMLYALEELEHNFEWLEEGLKRLGEDYVLFDLPGQLVVVHLSDCICLTQPSLYISNLLLSLRAMLQMDMPHVNVLSKIDKISTYDPLPYNLDYYTDVDDLSRLEPMLERETRNGKFSRLTAAIGSMIESYGLVRYEVLAVENKRSMMHLLRVIDRAGGYVFGGAEGANDSIWQVAMRNESSMVDAIDPQERWIDQKEAYDEMERLEDEEQANRLAKSDMDMEE